MQRRSLLATLAGVMAGATASVLGETPILAAATGRPARLYQPMVASPVIALHGAADEMHEIDVTAYGVPARAVGVHLAGWAAVERPGKLWAFSDALGKHSGAYHVREASVDWMFVPVTRGEVCIMGSRAWVTDLRIVGYWL